MNKVLSVLVVLLVLSVLSVLQALWEIVARPDRPDLLGHPEEWGHAGPAEVTVRQVYQAR